MTARNWSTTAANNNSAPPYGSPEGQAPSSVNNVIRQIMADARDTFEQLPWFDFGHTPTRVDNDTFTVPADLTTFYTVGRRLKLVGATTGYAVITASAFTTLTTVDVTMDSGNIPTSLATVSLGLDGNVLNQALIGAIFYPRTAAEIAASVTPVNYFYPECWADRYATNTTPGTTDMTAAIQAALNVANASPTGQREAILLGKTYLTGTIAWPGDNITLRGLNSGWSYFDPGSQKTILKAKAATGTVLNLVVTGSAIDRQGNLITDVKIDGNSIATVGIDSALGNLIERVTVTGCTTAGVRIPNFGNATRLRQCALIANSGWGLQVLGASTTAYSVSETNISRNTLGGLDLEAGVLASFDRCIIESNAGPGLKIFKPNTHTGCFYGFDFLTCWFEDNGSTAPNYTLSFSAGTSSQSTSPQRIRFRNCRINPSSATRKYFFADVVTWLTFEECNFVSSTASDAITLASNARFVAILESSDAGISIDGITATQMDNAIAQGSRCYSSDRTITRQVGAAAPAAAFQNSWVNFGGGFTPAQYWFDAQGFVCLAGSVKSGTVGNPVFTLPVGYRPTTQYAFSVNANGAFGLVYVNTSGTVVINTGSTTITSLDGIRFPTI